MSEFPRIFAHRGASSLAPENTIAAFSKAMEVGARWFEFDVDIADDGSLGDNPYNRELTEKEKEYREKNGNHFEELKELYKKAVQNPNVEQKISY